MIEMTTNCASIPIHILGALSRTVCEIQLPLFENWRGELEPNSIPSLTQFSEDIDT